MADDSSSSEYSSDEDLIYNTFVNLIEKTIKKVKPVTPEIQLPTYTDEEIEKLISYMKKITILFALNEKDWDDDCYSIMKKWLIDVTECLLIIFYDGVTLKARLTFPLTPINDLIYFVRQPMHIFSIEKFHDEISFGSMHEDIDGSLLKILNFIYAPLFYQYTEWNENVRAKFRSGLNKFLSLLIDWHYKISGMTVLFVPNTVQDWDIEKAALDRKLTKNLEDIAIMWGKQIRLCLEDKQQLVPKDLICPIDEYEFWLYRYEVLQGLYLQLVNKDLQKIIDVLKKVQSVYVKQLDQLMNDVKNEMDISKSNIKYLQLIVKPCKELEKIENPSKIPPNLSKIIHIFRYIWLYSDYYNTKELITDLFRDLSNQIIIYCRKQININKVLEGNPRFGIKMCNMAIDCCMAYKQIYNKISIEHIKRNPEIDWNLDNAMIFNHINALIERLYDVIDISESMIVFSRLDETEDIPKPKFGGVKGPEFELIFENVEKMFQNEMKRIINNSKDIILNVHSKQWYDDVLKYRHMVSSIEEILQRLISDVCLNICNIEEGIEVLASLYFFCYKTSLKKSFVRQTSEIWQQFLTEIEETNKKLIQFARYRESWIPQYSSRIIRIKISLERLKWIYNRLVNAYWLPQVTIAVTAINEFLQLEVDYNKTIKKTFEDWSDSVGPNIMNKLEKYLIRKSIINIGLLECNMDMDIMFILDEAKFMEQLGLTIPQNIMPLYSKYQNIKFIYNSVCQVCYDYNKIIDALYPDEKKLFKKLINEMDRKIAPGYLKLTWNGEMSESYIADCVKHTSELQEFLDIYKRVNKNICRICEEICDMPILKVLQNSIGTLQNLINNIQEYREKTIRILKNLHKSIVELIQTVFDRGFESVHSKMINEWSNYVRKFDNMLECAILICAKQSMTNILDGIRQEGSVTKSPIISMDIDLIDRKVTFTPSYDLILKYFSDVHSTVIRSFENFSRLRSKFSIYVSEEADFHKLILKNDESQETITILQFIVINSSKLKYTILGHVDEWQSRYIALLQKKSTEAIQAIYDYMESNARAVLTIPRTLSAIKTSIQLYNKLINEISIKQSEFSPIYDLFKVLDKYEIPVEKSVRVMVNTLEVEWQNYIKKLAEADEMLGNSKDEFKGELLKQVDKFKNIINEMTMDFIEKAPITSKTTTKAAVRYFEIIRKRINNLYEFEECLLNDLNFFNVMIFENLELKKLDKELKILEEVWNLVLVWEDSLNKWRYDNFWEINIDEMEDKAVTIYRQFNQLCKKYKDKNLEILETKRKTVNDFRRTLQMITALKNPSMRKRHWDKVKSLMKVNFNEHSPEFNIDALISMDFQAYSDDIQDISNSATMELQIEMGIKNIAEIWKTITFEMILHHDEIYRIKNVDDCFQVLEEHAVQISSMKSTRFVEPFAKEVDKWEKTLSYITESLEKALVVQRQYLYLENIFLGEDIKLQLPQEAANFDSIIAEWKYITSKMYYGATAFKATHFRPPNYLINRLNIMDTKLELIQRALEVYLESKRQLFPRFYFISNDDLLEILGNSRRPDLIQSHLKKLFDNLYKLDIRKVEDRKRLRWQSFGMYSDDGETVEFQEAMFCEGPAEDWLNVVEQRMIQTLKVNLKSVKESLRNNTKDREKWLKLWPGQLCLTCAQIQWTTNCTRSLILCKTLDSKKPLKKLKKKQNQILVKLCESSRKDLPKLLRLKVNTLITIEIHSRDVIERMYKANCRDVSNFEWFSQLRFYYDRNSDLCVIHQTNTEHTYGYEYTGNSGRLVITPLTDRCYITLTTALHLYRGGSPKGPAGTGKTETVKDLGKALGIWVIVTNCSEGLDYKSIGKNFSGLAQQGAWGCFDEFNRINVEVLSVVAQQISSILSALMAKKKKFVFEGTEIKLCREVGLFITMNPGYAGRTELPDNLKSMFRPIAMMTPDNAIIAENLLTSDGFEKGKNLAKKVFILYELAKQQLSKQCHYDFGLRSMVALLRYAGLKRRQLPNTNEEEIIYLAMKDMNVARLTSNDLPLFNGIMLDIFPGVTIPVIDYSIFQESIELELTTNNYQAIPIAIKKIIELYETKNSRHSTMLIGDSGSAKSVTWKVLQGAFNRMKAINKEGFENIAVYPINPKALSQAELYGEYNLTTGEWLDGVISSIMRSVCAEETPSLKWILFDGPVDAVWIENMNSVMDDNKILTLVNSERISMPNTVSLLFEAADLAVASPATVSRCGTVYNDYNDFGWKPYVNSWLTKQNPKEYVALLTDLFDKFTDKCLEFKKQNCRETVPVNDLCSIIQLCNLLEILASKDIRIVSDNIEHLTAMTTIWFVFCLTWSVCATVDEDGRTKFDAFIRDNENCFPMKDTIYDYYVDLKQKNFVPWENKLSETWRYLKDTPFYKIVVPTVDTVRYEYLVLNLLLSDKPIMLVGGVGTGKSSTAASVLEAIDKEKYTVLSINMSGQTTAPGLQESIENKTEKCTKVLFAPPGGKKMIVFMDDFNMPIKDEYGSQPPLELVRQWLDYKFWYNRKNQQRVYVSNCTPMSAMGEPGGGRQVISSRTLSRFSVINVIFPNFATIIRIFGTILKQKTSDFMNDIRLSWKSMAEATFDLYNSVKSKMLPTPTKSHYLFNLRDISKIYQGLLRSNPESQNTKLAMLKLWVHECFRVFCDRLVDKLEIDWFLNQVSSTLGKYFGFEYNDVCPDKRSPIFGDFMSASGYYEDLCPRNIDDLRQFLIAQQENYNISPGMARIDLVFFREAIEHITKIVRIISQPRGHVLNIGIGGSGRQSMTSMATFVCELNMFRIEVTKKYKTQEFREDLKSLYKITGVKNRGTVFLFNDEQIVENNFLEILNNILSTGEANLFKIEEFEELKNEIEPLAKKNNVILTTESMYNFFMLTVRNNLHLVLNLTPVGENFRLYIRQYPALINSTTCNYFRTWSKEALLEVAEKFLYDIKLNIPTPSVLLQINRDSFIKSTENQMRIDIAHIFSDIHLGVRETSNIMLNEMKRYNYVTPMNYLELVAGFQDLLKKKRSEISKYANRLRNGLSKIEETSEKVGVMSEELKVSQIQVAELAIQCEHFIVEINTQQKEAEVKKAEVIAKSQVIEFEELECKTLAEVAQKDLNLVLPMIDDAISALDALSKKDISEVKSYGRPPVKVEKVMEAVMVILNKKPDWETSKKTLGEPNFLNDLKNFDKDNIQEKTLKKLVAYTRDPELEPNKVGVVSFACKSLMQWILAIENYAKVYRIVVPKQAKLNEALESLRMKQIMLEEARQQLSELIQKLIKLQEEFDQKSKVLNALKENAHKLELHLERAKFLVESLTGEQQRWIDIVASLDIQFSHLPGNCLIAIGFVSYLGPFDIKYRRMLFETWSKEVINRQIPATEDLNINLFLSDAVTIREWNIQGLPTDDFSTENGIIMTSCRRWPLIIDPQMQAHNWIRNLEEKNDLQIIDFGTVEFLKILEKALQFGMPVLLQNVSEFLDPVINPILKKVFAISGGLKMIKFNDKLITYNENFKLYIQTKLSNPHYPPEISSKTTLVNFAIKESGLQAQLLGLIVRKEKPILEEMKNDLVVTIGKNKKTLIDLETDILRLLNESKGSLLENDELFFTLSKSKKISADVKDSLNTAEITEIEIDLARQDYVPAAKRSAILFFVLMDISKIDPMYQFSLNSYVLLFMQSIERSPKSTNLAERITNINDYHTYAVYNNTCRGLFENHKLLFSMHMCVKILQASNDIDMNEYDFFLKGGIMMDKQEYVENPRPDWIGEESWDNITMLDKISEFHGIVDSLQTNPKLWLEWYSTTAPESVPLVGEWDKKLTDFQKMCVIRSLRPDRISACLSQFIINILGPRFIEPPVLDLAQVLEESIAQIPLIFVLSPGVDPTASLVSLAESSNMSSNLFSLSLGQGQAPIATKLLMQGIKDGSWIFLANCHLSLSWMPLLDKIIETFQSTKIHKRFRLWLSSSPHPDFPISILQTSIKMTTEPPRGIKANMKRLYQNVTDENFLKLQDPSKYKKLLFCLCFFHTILLERKKFLQLGWNVIYSFNDSDFDVSESLLTLYLKEYEQTPFDALKYLIADVNYGGHVTDDWDRRLLITYVNQYFNNSVLEVSNYNLSSLSTYYVPGDGDVLYYQDYITFLPQEDKPEAFGQHPNADIASLITVTRFIFETLQSMEVQAATTEGESRESKVLKMANDIEVKIPINIDYENTAKTIGLKKNPLEVVLLQEIERYNMLLTKIRNDLRDLQKGIKGVVVMSVELDDIFNAVNVGRVPSAWLKTYGSQKPLGSWSRDLILRVEVFNSWSKTLQPPKFQWLSAYTFPTGFLTAVLQIAARVNETPIDEFSWEFYVFSEDELQIAQTQLKTGVFVRGLYLEGAGWNLRGQCLIEPQPMELISSMPIIHFKPVKNLKKKTKGVYNCPSYYYPTRAGSFVIAVDLNSGLENSDFWIKRGTAILLSLAT
ncbi:dynein axonemal heavy chain 2 [Condylostylus longicornis]|uniref:dynein axonemal heavy chain 2 n=1 Tax=Condylostylus longicornis TaxID=2530218 RepID=UPI00244DE4C2|nr:dynein axonemal heavy chain 2 [Condylostylus longicornis]